jgi:hypothetical protein
MIDDLRRAGQLALYWDLRSGTFLDFSGRGFNGTVSGTCGSPRPWFDARPSGIVTTAAALPADNYSVCCLLGSRHYTPAASQYVIYVDATHYAVLGTGGLFSVYGGGTIRNSASVVGGQSIGWNHVTGATGAVYRDGVSIGAFSGVLDAVTLAAGTKYFFNASGGASPLAYGIKALVITSAVLSATQHSQLVGDLLSEIRWPTRPATRSYHDISVNPKTPNLFWAPKLSEPMVNGVLVDTSPNCYNSTVHTGAHKVPPIYNKDSYGGSFNYTGTYHITGPVTFPRSNDFTMVAVVKPTSFTNYPSVGGLNAYWMMYFWQITPTTASLYHFNGVADFQCPGVVIRRDQTYFLANVVNPDDSVSFYVNGEFIATVAGAGGGHGLSTLVAGTNGGYDFWGNIYRLEIYLGALSAADVSRLYDQSGIKQIGYSSDWGSPVSTAIRGGIANSSLETTGFRFGSATPRYSVDVSTINGSAVKTIKCNTAGHIYLPVSELGQTPQESAYGTTEFSFNKASNVNDIWVYFISQTSGTYLTTGGPGYVCRITGTGIEVRRVNGVGSTTTIMVAGSVVLTNPTWYTIRITRSYSGVFTMWIKGGSYTNWTLVGTATDNTHTTSNYIVIDNDANDMISLGSVDGEYTIKKMIA